MPVGSQHIKTVASGLAAQLSHCTLCPRQCGVDRLAGEQGYCETGPDPEISGFESHFGEEGCLIGTRGSGAVFFTGCNLRCVFCQTFEISQLHQGTAISIEELAGIMLALQREGCHNLNLVTPTHQVAAVVKALDQAAAKGFNLPVVYNSSGYESVETLQALAGLVDIYLPDFKVWDEDAAERYLGAKDYPAVAREAIKEMHRQVGDLVLDKDGLARRGVLLRHLVLPEGLAGTAEILHFIQEQISPETCVNLMGHYHPCGRADAFPPLDRPLHHAEFDAALAMAREIGLSRLDETHRPLLSLLLRD